MRLAEIKRLLAAYGGEITEVNGVECVICTYSERRFWVYLMPGKRIEQLVFSYISDHSLPQVELKALNSFNRDAHVGRAFLDDERQLNLNAKLVGQFEELRPKSFVMFLEAWVDDFDRLLPTLHRDGE